MTKVSASTSAKSRPDLRTPIAAAQTRVVSGGEVWPIQRELSRHLKYMARARISEFESSQASHAVQSRAYASCPCGSPGEPYEFYSELDFDIPRFIGDLSAVHAEADHGSTKNTRPDPTNEFGEPAPRKPVW